MFHTERLLLPIVLGLQVYARPVLKVIDTDGNIFKGVLFRDSCTQIKVGNSAFYAKDLKSFGPNIYDEKRIVLVDNNILSFSVQPNNAIHVSDWYDSADDTELSQVKELILHFIHIDNS